MLGVFRILVFGLLAVFTANGQIVLDGTGVPVAVDGTGVKPSVNEIIPPTLTIDEDFEETGTPTAGTWASVSGSPDYDSTTHVVLDGEALRCSSTASARVDTSSTDRYLKLEYQGAALSAVKLLYVIWSDGDVALGLRESASEKMAIYLNNSDGTFSTTFTFQAGTKYYVWMDYFPSGTCYVGISTIDSKPSPGTDTTTAWADSGTDIGSANPTHIQMFNIATNHWSDNWKVSDSIL